uniref:Uncharacterized protein n=1 Tax=Kalanchoe fedtschenkoi TaxID=63787 RepID=A0A7N0T454_KALFE
MSVLADKRNAFLDRGGSEGVYDSVVNDDDETSLSISRESSFIRLSIVLFRNSIFLELGRQTPGKSPGGKLRKVTGRLQFKGRHGEWKCPTRAVPSVRFMV